MDGKRIYFDRQSVFDLTVMSTDQEEKKEAIKISGVVMSVKILGTGSFLPEKSVSNDDLSKVE